MNRADFLRRFGVAVVASVVAPLGRWGGSAPILYGDGEHDDAPALQAIIDGEPVIRRDIGRTVPEVSDGTLAGRTYLVREQLNLRADPVLRIPPENAGKTVLASPYTWRRA